VPSFAFFIICNLKEKGKVVLHAVVIMLFYSFEKCLNRSWVFIKHSAKCITAGCQIDGASVALTPHKFVKLLFMLQS